MTQVHIPIDCPFITARELRDVLAQQGWSVSEAALSTWRAEGRGPPFIKLHPTARIRILYPRDKVITWLEQTLSGDAPTSEPARMMEAAHG